MTRTAVEVAARGGRLILIGDKHAAETAGVAIEHVLGPKPGMLIKRRASRRLPGGAEGIRTDGHRTVLHVSSKPTVE